MVAELSVAILMEYSDLFLIPVFHIPYSVYCVNEVIPDSHFSSTQSFSAGKEL